MTKFRRLASRVNMVAALCVSVIAASLVLTACAVPAAEEANESTTATATATVVIEAPTPIPTETVEPTQAPTATLAEPTSQPAKAEEQPDAAQYAELGAKVEAALDSFVQGQQFSGVVLVAREGDIVLAKGYGDADRANGIPNDASTRYRIGSLTKPFTAMIVLLLQERGVLDIHDPICDYVEACPEAWSTITIEHLLTHTSGVPDFTRFPDYEPTKGKPTTLPDTIDRFRNVPLDFQPGERWNYTNSGYILLGQIIETATGQPYEDVTQELIFTPLSMTDTGYDHNGEDLANGYVNGSDAQPDFIHMSIPHAAGALYSTAEDLLKWDRALAEGSLISPNLQGAMFTTHAMIPDSPGFGYGYGWVIAEVFDQPVVFHNGGIEGFVSNITRFLGDDTLIVMLSSQEQTNPQAVAQTVMQAIHTEE